MKRKQIIIFILATCLFASCVSDKQKENTISISGAFALYPLIVQWAEAYKTEHPEMRFNISGGGAGKGMADALSQTVDLGMFSREISEAETEQGVWWTGLAIDAVMPTISAENPWLDQLKKRGLSQEEFRKIYIEGSIKTWDQLLNQVENKKITVYTRSDACGAAGTWAKFLGGTQENINGVGIYGDPGLADAVANDKNGIGFNNTIFIYDINTGKKRPGIEVIPIDLNGDGMISGQENFYETFNEVLFAIASGIYPSPPSRELYFVSKGKPAKPSTISFIQWCLTDGQKYVSKAGYVPLPPAALDSYLQKLK